MLKIKAFRKIITPDIGIRLAGYGSDVYSNGIHDDLYISGIAFGDERKKKLLLSYDLLGMDRALVLEIRKNICKAHGITEEDVVISCTHTHSGPHTRSSTRKNMRDLEYSKKLVAWSVEAVDGVFENMTAVDVYSYSVNVPDNVNRRVVLPGNIFAYLPYLRHLQPNAEGIVDQEVGMLFFVEKGGGKLISSIVNYSAHPLSSQSSGESSLKITSDYPGVLRNIVERDLGGLCVFVTGACGDLHPRDFECGFEKTEEMGRHLAVQVVSGFSQALRTKRCKLKDPVLDSRSATVDLELKRNPGEKMMPPFRNKKYERAEMHFLRIGDVCFVGVPGELLAEPGLEIKWNSPFRKTYILYNSTGYLSYMPHANAYVSGGYEVETSQVKQYETFRFVVKTVNELSRWIK